MLQRHEAERPVPVAWEDDTFAHDAKLKEGCERGIRPKPAT